VTAGVRAFDELTVRGRARRLRDLALGALRVYDLDVTRCAYVARAFNTVFRVDAANGSSYALRVSPSLRIHADGCEVEEAAWLAALRRDAGLPVPEVIPARDGSVVVWTSIPGVPDARSCVLFEWVGGRPLRERLRADLVRGVGELTAVVHQHGAGYASEPPAGVLIADRVLYFRAAPRLDELRPAYGSLLDDALDRAQEAIDRLWRDPPHAPHLLHGDLQSGNVMVHRDQLTLIDFQDLIWGFEVQDVSIALLALEQHGDTGSWSHAFRSGYETVQPWPDAEPATIAALRAARHLNILNFGLSVRGPDLEAFTARHAAPVVEWMTRRMK
jgi:Ser/Thr protein kinase RdoA (MazF antagonist)